MRIESTQNEKVKRARDLMNNKGRKQTGLHFIEGERLVREAVVSGAAVVEAFLEEGHELMAAVLEGSGASVYTVTRAVMEKLTATNTPQWVCATVKTEKAELPEYYPSGLIVVLDGVQDPGNMGTIIRTADAMGAVGVILGEGCADPYAPKPMRSAMGSVYHLSIWQTEDLTSEIKKLYAQDFTMICGHLKGGSTLPEIKSKCAIIIGNEGNGVRDSVADLCTKYRLPMYGYAESLNASVAAGIMIYEAAKNMNSK